MRAKVSSIADNPIGNFISWAAKRIEQEVLENERVFMQSGQTDYMQEGKPMKGRKIPKENKLEMVCTIMERKKNGCSIKDACEDIGIHPCTYGKWKRAFIKEGLI